MIKGYTPASLRILIVLLSIIALTITMASCNEEEEDGSGSGASTGGTSSHLKIKLDANTVAIVDGKPVEKAKFDAKVESELATYTSGGIEITDEVRRGVKRDVFARMASDIVIMEKAEELGVAVPFETAKADVDKVIASMGGEDAVLSFLGSMGGGIKTIDEFIEWKRSEMTREALIDKVGTEVEIDETALKAEFDKLMADYEKARNEGKPALSPGGSFEEYLERRKLQAKLVDFDKYIDAALTTAKVEVGDPDLEGALEEYAKLSYDATGGMNPHGGMGTGMGGGNPHGGMGSGMGTNPHGNMGAGAGMQNPHGGAGGSGSGEGKGKDIGSAHG